DARDLGLLHRRARITPARGDDEVADHHEGEDRPAHDEGRRAALLADAPGARALRDEGTAAALADDLLVEQVDGHAVRGTAGGALDVGLAFALVAVARGARGGAGAGAAAAGTGRSRARAGGASSACQSWTPD